MAKDPPVAFLYSKVKAQRHNNKTFVAVKIATLMFKIIV